MRIRIWLYLVLFMLTIFLMGFRHGMVEVEDQQLQYVAVVTTVSVPKSTESLVAADDNNNNNNNNNNKKEEGSWSDQPSVPPERPQPVDDVHFKVKNIDTSTGADACSEFKSSLLRKRTATFSVVLTTYKGHEIIKRTINTWREAGIFSHPLYGETIIHVNACTKADVDLLRTLLAGVASVQIVCNSGNRIWTVAFYNALSRTSGTSILFSENDRPIQHLLGETKEQLQTRVQTFLSKSLDIISDRRTPFVSLKKFISKEDEQMFADNQTMEAQVTEGDSSGVNCWSNCLSRITDANRHGEEKVFAQCDDLMSKIQTVPFPECEKWTCKELVSFRKGTGWGSMCYPSMVRNFKKSRSVRETIISEHKFTYPYADRSSVNATRVVCLKVNWWNNEPALYSFSWAKELFSFACRSDRSRLDSGLTFLTHKPWFGRYGRRFETFFTKYAIAVDTLPHCYGDGLFTHYEPVSYDKTHATG